MGKTDNTNNINKDVAKIGERFLTYDERSESEDLDRTALFEAQLSRIYQALNVKNPTELARAIGKKQSTVWPSVNKQRIPDSWLTSIYRKFGISLQWILDGTGPMKVSPLPKPLPPPTIALDGFPSDAEFHEAKGFSIQEDLNIAARVLVSDTPYAVALHLNIRSFGDALQQRDDMKAMKETLRDQSRTIMRLQEEAETIKQERQEEKKEAVSMRKEVEELKAQLARLLSTGGDCPDHSEEVA